MIRVLILALSASLMTACTTVPENHGAENLDAVFANRTAVILAGIESGDMTQVLGLFTEDALYSPSGDSLLSDRAALAAYWDSVAESPASDAVLDVVDVTWLAPDAFVEIQRYEVYGAEGEHLFSGYASLLWRKIDGRWLIASDVSNH